MGASGVPFVYVGGTDGNITIYRLDRGAKTLTLDDTVAAGNYPSFLAVNPAQTMLYATLEGSTSVAAFAIDQATGGLTKRGSDQQSGGGAPTHVSVDKTGGWVMVANYNGGSVRVFPVMNDGSLGAPSDTKMPGRTRISSSRTPRTPSPSSVQGLGSHRAVRVQRTDR
jgi:6-phosphogluconolactonase